MHKYNAIYNEDVMSVLRRQPDNSINCIYSDPDYNVGIKYNGVSHSMKMSDYDIWYYQLIKECLRVLKPDGNIFTINYARQNASLWMSVEKYAHSINEYIWIHNPHIGTSNRKFTKGHRNILHITKTARNAFYKASVALPYQNLNDKRIQQRMADGSSGRMPYSWFYFDLVKNVSKERVDHPCQIPTKLARLLFNASTAVGDCIFILFAGSGNECVLAREMGRNFISCETDASYWASAQGKINKLGG